MVNILNILVDDVGIEQFARFGRGSNYPSTPTINGWYDGGVRFTKYYVEQLCSPTRASMLTGLHPYGHGIGDLIRGPLAGFTTTNAVGLRSPTVATMIRRKRPDIRTAAFGKWHLASDYGGGLRGPLNSGFEHFSGNMFNLQTGTESYYDWNKNTNGVVQREDEYMPIVMAREASEWIRQRGTEPWVLHLAPYSCHTPLLTTGVPPSGTYNVAWNTATDNGVFKACIESIDYYLARLVSEIPASVWNNTIVIFSTDNGSGGDTVSLETDPITGSAYPSAVTDPYCTKVSDGSAHPGTRGKDTPFDTGVHVPLIFYSPGGLIASPNRTVSHPVQAADIVPTILDLLGITTEETLHGSSIKPYLDNTTSSAIHDLVYSEHFLQNQAVRDEDRIESQWMAYDGRYTLVYTQPLGYRESWHFYDLDADPHQITNLTPGGSIAGLNSAQRTARAALLAGRAALVADV